MDYANEQSDPGIRMGDSIVMLSAAKHLAAQRDSPFAEFTLSVSEGLRACPEAKPNGVTGEGPMSSSVLFFETALSALGACSTIRIILLQITNYLFCI